MIRTLARLAALPIVAIVSLGGLLLAAAPAHAAWELPENPSPGANHVMIDCLDGRIVISPFMAVDRGYLGGQYMVYRYHLKNSYGYAGTSGWSGSKLMPLTAVGRTGTRIDYGLAAHSQADVGATRGANWEVYVQVGRWVPGQGYRYSGWLKPNLVTTYTQGRLYVAPWATCRT